MNSTIEKRIYATPYIVEIKLDHEISLQLESPPVGPDEPGFLGSLTPEFYKNDVFRNA